MLRAAFGLGPPVDLDRFAIAAATLGLLAAAAEERPLLVLVDDAQWLDPVGGRAAVRHQAARGRSCGLLFAAATARTAVRSAGDRGDSLIGLQREAAPGFSGRVEVTFEVADRLYNATGGNPLALVELPSLLSADQLAGTEPLRSRFRRDRASSGRSLVVRRRCPRRHSGRCSWSRSPRRPRRR